MFDKNSIWNEKKYQEFVQYLETQKEDESFIAFSKKLIFTKYKMIGIKVPNLRRIAKEINQTDILSFLEVSKDNTYEEVMLQGLVISYIKDVDISLKYFNHFIKKIDNWSICDVCVSSMKIVKKNKKNFLKQIKKYLKRKNEFIVRVGIILLLDYYIDDDDIDEIFSLIDHLNREEYYINMSIAWLISVCFIKQREKTMFYLKNNHLNQFTYNKAIQKMIESLRVSEEDKIMLKQMKRKV